MIVIKTAFLLLKQVFVLCPHPRIYTCTYNIVTFSDRFQILSIPLKFSYLTGALSIPTLHLSFERKKGQITDSPIIADILLILCTAPCKDACTGTRKKHGKKMVRNILHYWKKVTTWNVIKITQLILCLNHNPCSKVCLLNRKLRDSAKISQLN